MTHPTHIIFDLDGLILDTEMICLEVARTVVARYGKEITPAAQRLALGKRPIDCWRDLKTELGIEVSAEQLMAETEALLSPRWELAAMLPGAERMLRHLAACGVPMAVATSTPRATFQSKMMRRPEIEALFQAVVCGDEVPNGKPAPDLFLAAAKAIGADPSTCIVVEDAPSGVEGAVAAGMRVIVVPSLVDKSEYPSPDPTAKSGVVEVLPTLLDFQPQTYDIPPFTDLLPAGVIPVIPPIIIRGTVVKGFGRGSKELGIPTANVDPGSLGCTLSEAVTGIYSGWASVGASSAVYPMVMSIGWNPFFENREKTAEPWILHDFDKAFYNEEIRLVVSGYIRPEASFPSLEALIKRIHQDGACARASLQAESQQAFKSHAALLPSSTLPS